MSDLAAIELEHRLAAAEKALAERDAEISRLKDELKIQDDACEIYERQCAELKAENAKLREALEDSCDALFLLLKRVTKLGEVQGEPGSPIEKGWKACDKSRKALGWA